MRSLPFLELCFLKSKKAPVIRDFLPSKTINWIATEQMVTQTLSTHARVTQTQLRYKLL